MDILLFIVGVALVLIGADVFTDGASKLARYMRLSELIIGLTVVSFGTSAPELFTSAVSALKHANGLAIGNVIGSNIFNTTLIVGCSAAVATIPILPITIKRDVPFALVASLLLCLLAFDGEISRLDAIVLLAVFAYFMFTTLRGARKDAPLQEEKPLVATWKNYLLCGIAIVGGLGMLILGSNLFVESASNIAHRIHVDETIIGLTIVAGGTSLPELATSIVAAKKGQSGIAIGNVIGSNVFNILFVLGLSGLIVPIGVSGVSFVDFFVLTSTIILVWWMAYTKYEINRIEGCTMVIIYAVYLGYLIYKCLQPAF